MPIPNIVHFCFGMTPDFGGRPFSISHYLAVRSAWEILQPECMIMHFDHEPTGEWWELAKPMLFLHKVAPVRGIYGFPAANPAHRADIVRLAALISMGGIYLDTDVLVVKSFDPLHDAPFVAAREVTKDGTTVGLSNAILLAQPRSRFAELCLKGHDPSCSLWQGFRSRGRDENYVEYSVRYPCMLADLCPGMLRALPPESFLWVTWDQSDLQALFEEKRDVPEEVLALHLWESHSWEKYLSKLTLEEIRENDTTFNRLARPFLPGSATGASRVRSAPPDPDGLARIDAICKDADFILAENQAPGSVRERVRRWTRRSIRNLRREIMLPLRCVQERMEQRMEAHLRTLGPPPFCVQEPESSGWPLLRFGSLDGSQALLEKILRSKSHGSIRFAMFTGASTEPGVCAWLASQPNAAGVWVSGSLARAKQLAEWSVETGAIVRCIHADWLAADQGSYIPKGLIPENLTVMILAGSGREFQQWECLQDTLAEIILVACNPLMTGDCVHSEPDPDPSGLRWGASKAAFLHLAAHRSYSLVAESPDGLFLVFGRQHSDESDALGSGEPRPPSYVRVRTLYGQLIHVPMSEVERPRILKDEPLS